MEQQIVNPQTFSLKLTDLEKKTLDDKSDIPTQNLDEIARGLNIEDDTPVVTKKRGRKSLEEKQVELEEKSSEYKLLAQEFVSNIMPLLEMGLNMAFLRMRNPTPVKKTELEMLEKTLVPVAIKYAPKLGKVQPEYMAVGALAMMIVPRMIEQKE